MKNKIWKNILDMVKPHKKAIVLISILAICINLVEVAKPYLVKVVIDDYLSLGIREKGVITVTMIGIIYLVLVILGNCLDLIVVTTTNRMGNKVVNNLRNRLFSYFQKANITFHDKTPAGKLFVRITSDAEDILMLFRDVISTIARDIIMILAILIMMLCVDKQLALISFTIIPLIVITSISLTYINNRLHEKSKVLKTNLNTFLAESIYGVKVIKIFNRFKEKEKECEDLGQKYWKSMLPMGIVEGILPAIMYLLENLGISLICWACVKQWMGINIEVGVLYMFITYIRQIFEPINRLIENFETVQEAVVSINKIYEILNDTQNLEDFQKGKNIEKIKGKIEFRNVWFAYKENNWVLKNVSFTINPGESIALVGKTGSGKTTITNLINRFYEIQKGEIFIDDINIKDINIKSLREKIGTILQDPFIFAKSIEDNIRLNKNISDEKIDEAIKLASADVFVNSLPNGKKEIAKERGNTYSTGQKQLLAFARIFAHNPSIFILDEATANIDTQTEKLIQKSVDKISEEKTSIFIAHRLSTIVNVDKIFVLKEGKIIEQGNHNELLQKQDGYYSKLYQAYYNGIE